MIGLISWWWICPRSIIADHRWISIGSKMMRMGIGMRRCFMTNTAQWWTGIGTGCRRTCSDGAFAICSLRFFQSFSTTLFRRFPFLFTIFCTTIFKPHLIRRKMKEKCRWRMIMMKKERECLCSGWLTFSSCRCLRFNMHFGHHFHSSWSCIEFHQSRTEEKRREMFTNGSKFIST